MSWYSDNGAFRTEHGIDPLPQHLLKFLSHKERVRYKFKLRASSLPFCPREYSLARVLDKKDLPYLTSTFMDDAILSTGHVFHSVIQRWMGAAGTLVGSWVCTGCGKKKAWREGAPKCYNDECSMFEQPMQYAEIDLIDYGTGMTAHPDGLFFTPERVLEGLEFKTTGHTNIEKLDEPYDSHLNYQAAAYARLLKKNKGLDLRYFTFIYINRSLPTTFKILYSEKHGKDTTVVAKSFGGKFTLLKMFRREIDFEGIEEEFIKVKVVQKLQKKIGKVLIPRSYSLGYAMCEKQGDSPFCPLSGICFTNWVDKKYDVLSRKKLPVLNG